MGRAAETEGHIHEAFLSPSDIFAHRWMHIVGVAKLQLGADTEAAGWLRRSIDTNRNFPFTHFMLAAALGLLGELAQARAAVQAGIALDPGFTIRRFRDVTYAISENPTFRAGRDRLIEGMRMAGVPEG